MAPLPSSLAREARAVEMADSILLVRHRENKQQQMIGMKKTLVFHRRHALKGEGTALIMHEYRIIEPEFESGEQGGYVMYRLFQKQVDKTERSIPEEMDRSGYSLPLLTTWKQTRKLSHF